MHIDFKLGDGELIYVRHRESALNGKGGVELLSTIIQSRIKSSGKTIRWSVIGTDI